MKKKISRRHGIGISTHAFEYFFRKLFETVFENEKKKKSFIIFIRMLRETDRWEGDTLYAYRSLRSQEVHHNKPRGYFSNGMSNDVY